MMEKVCFCVHFLPPFILNSIVVEVIGNLISSLLNLYAFAGCSLGADESRADPTRLCHLTCFLYSLSLLLCTFRLLKMLRPSARQEGLHNLGPGSWAVESQGRGDFVCQCLSLVFCMGLSRHLF